MTGEMLQEFRRRLKSEEYIVKLNKSGAGSVSDGVQGISVMKDGEIRFKPESKYLAKNVKKIRDEVQEYMTAFLDGDPNKRRIDSTFCHDARTLLLYNSYELTAWKTSDNDIAFETFRIDRDNNRKNGYYTQYYADAKRNFALRAGLISQDRVFTDLELIEIRLGLSNFLFQSTVDRIALKEEKEIRNVLEKIGRAMAAEFLERPSNVVDDEYELE
jgi:hypothetical protein